MKIKCGRLTKLKKMMPGTCWHRAVLFLIVLWLPLTEFTKLYEPKQGAIDLGGSWDFYATQNESIKGRASVPGDIYTDLYRSGLTPYPLNDTNDQDLRWVGRTNWTYTRVFTVPSSVLLTAKELRLVFEGLDTVAAVSLNGHLLTRVSNQFTPVSLDVTKRILTTSNKLKIDFLSSVTAAQNAADAHLVNEGHRLPNTCPPEVQKGQCHVHQLRKMQASFSWDWGPSIPTVGIWRNVSLVYTSTKVFVDGIYPLVVVNDSSTARVDVDVDFHCTTITDTPAGLSVTVSLPQLALKSTETVNVSCKKTLESLQTARASIQVPKTAVDLWWPNGLGGQHLYTLVTKVVVDDFLVTTHKRRIGFRSIELVESAVDATNTSKGTNFAFLVNKVPVFLKGSNLVPITMLPGESTALRRRFLLKSAKMAHMNTLRVWGGGIYETDEFYELADELGILLWHDLMFACALYPRGKKFEASVRQEVTFQVRRLRSHPSILLWAGNNEIEQTLATFSSYTPNYSPSEQRSDYGALFNDTVRAAAVEADPTRVFLLSSPSNGLKRNAVVETDPDSNYAGDRHFYDSYGNFWIDYFFPTPRCASEYGIQSIPLRDTMMRSISNQSKYTFNSSIVSSRQHSMDGYFSLTKQLVQHFDSPRGSGEGYLARFSYLSQVQQAVAIQMESEHYRRWRGRLAPDGKGNTMCALFWQLNDVWAAPSWASIDAELEWKALHYAARRFFAPVILSLYTNPDGLLQVFIVSDNDKPLHNVVVTIDLLAWKNGFAPLATTRREVPLVPGRASTQVDVAPVRNDGPDMPTDVLIRGTLTANGSEVAPVAILYADNFYGRSDFGTVSIRKLKAVSSTVFNVTVVATRIAPFVWLDLTLEFKLRHPDLLFVFSDNAFTATQPVTNLTLAFFNAPRVDLAIGDVTVCHLGSCFV